MRLKFDRLFNPLTVCLMAIGLLVSAPARADDKPTLLLAGDSLGVGLTSRFKENGKTCGYRVVSASIGGTNTSQWSRWMPRKVAEVKPDVVVVSLGTNDSGIWGKYTLDRPEFVEKIVAAVEGTGAKIVWLGPPELPKKSLPLRDAIVDMIKVHVPLFFDTSPFRDGRTADKIHYTAQGSATWADAVWSFMRDKNVVACAEEKK